MGILTALTEIKMSVLTTFQLGNGGKNAAKIISENKKNHRHDYCGKNVLVDQGQHKSRPAPCAGRREISPYHLLRLYRQRRRLSGKRLCGLALEMPQ